MCGIYHQNFITNNPQNNPLMTNISIYHKFGYEIGGDYNMGKYSEHKEYYNEWGDEVPSSTTILSILNKPFLTKWGNILGFKRIKVEDSLEASSTVGTAVHDIIEAYFKNEKYNLPESKWYSREYIISFIDPFITWVHENNIEMKFTERSLTCDNYGGTIDFYGNFNGKKTILDWKTSKAFYVTMFLQLGSYAHLLDKNGFEYEQAAIVRVNSGKVVVKIISLDEINRYKEAFIKLAEIFHIMYSLCDDMGFPQISGKVGSKDGKK